MCTSLTFTFSTFYLLKSPYIYIYIYLYIYIIGLNSLGRESREVQASRCLPTRPTNKWVSHEKKRRYMFSAFWGYLNHLTLNNNIFFLLTFHGNMNMNIQEGKLEYLSVANCTRQIRLLILFVRGLKFSWKNIRILLKGDPSSSCVYLYTLP